MSYLVIVAIFVFTSCAGPSESLQKRFIADAWFMPLGEFKQAIKDSKAMAQTAFTSMCGSKGEVLPKDLQGKLKSVISHASDEALNECFSRIITAQTAPFGTMPEDEYNLLVAELFKEVQKRQIKLTQKWALASSLNQENLQNLFNYQIGFFYLLGHGDTLSFEARELAGKMMVDIRGRGDFENMGAYYDEDRVDQNIARFASLVEKFEGLKPFVRKVCSLTGERHVEGCKRMKKRFQSLAQLRSVAQAAKEHLKLKRKAYVQTNGLQPPPAPIHLDTPGRAIASEPTGE